MEKWYLSGPHSDGSAGIYTTPKSSPTSRIAHFAHVEMGPATLMALAPEMLAQLKRSQFALESVFHLTGNQDFLPQIQANADLIAKAEGKVI